MRTKDVTITRDAMVCSEARPILDIEHDSALKQMAAHHSSP
jgi:hypothetical protein